MIKACGLILLWNNKINSAKEYLYSDDNLETMAATCMMIESIGEQIKQISKLDKDLLSTLEPDLPWKNIMGMRDKIAHGYFNLDEDIIFDVAKNEVALWKSSLIKIKSILESDSDIKIK